MGRLCRPSHRDRGLHPPGLASRPQPSGHRSLPTVRVQDARLPIYAFAARPVPSPSRVPPRADQWGSQDQPQSRSVHPRFMSNMAHEFDERIRGLLTRRLALGTDGLAGAADAQMSLPIRLAGLGIARQKENAAIDRLAQLPARVSAEFPSARRDPAPLLRDPSPPGHRHGHL